MITARYQPWQLVQSLNRDLDQLLFPAGTADASREAVVDWVPPVDIREEEGQFVLNADLPGVDPKDIDVTLEKGILTVRGKRALPQRDDKAGYRRVERVNGEFYRRFSLPDTADSQQVRARFTNGVLEVSIPKQAQVLARRIDVEAA
jgi:HSP20 family protein